MRNRLNRTSLNRSALLCCLLLAASCADDSGDSNTTNGAGAASAGSNSGASGAGATGAVGSGGTAATGGSSTGGNSTGGNSTGGNSTGGNSTGGNSTGGNSTGGNSTGGSSAGGNSGANGGSSANAGTGGSSGAMGGAGGALPTAFGGDRPASLIVPTSYDPAVAIPLVVMLHGYSASGSIEELYLQFTPQAEARGFLYVHPQGTTDEQGNPFWNATDACCDFYGTMVDDDAYLMGLVDDISAAYSVDAKRIFFVGHSNGGFMSHRLACNHADKIAAIASLAGVQYSDLSNCTPSEPVAALQIHGTADETIAYTGGNIGPISFPGAVTTIEDWATLDGCDLTPDSSSPPIDLESTLPGDETTVTKYQQGCMQGGAAELWTINGGAHVPTLAPDFAERVIDFLFAHPKP